MNRINFTNLGGLPLSQQILDFMQVAASGPLGGLAELCGPLTIMSGVTVTGNTNANGWVAINGELLPFEGGTITGFVDIVETITQRTYEDAADKDVYIARKATNVVSGAYAWGDFVRIPRLRDMAPAGIVQPFAGAVASVPQGWLHCNGQAVSRTAYAGLFAAIGTTYGVGDGVNTFNLPDLQGRVAVGQDVLQAEFDVIGETGGIVSVTLDETQIPSHSHTMNWDRTKRGEGSDPNDAAAAPDGSHFGTDFSKSTSSTGGSQAHTNLQPYIVMPYIIKF
jgi:microcystin-dependent protein